MSDSCESEQSVRRGSWRLTGRIAVKLLDKLTFVKSVDNYRPVMATRVGADRVRVMELVPKLFLAGIFMGPPTQEDAINRQRLNQVWADVAGKYDDYVQLQVSPDGHSAEFAGSMPPEGVSIQPPLVQVRDAIRLTAEQSAEKAADIMRIVGRHLSVGQFFNLGVKHLYHFTPLSNDARSFMQDVLGKTDNDLSDLGHGVIPGVKYFVPHPEAEQLFTVVIEPLLSDPEHRTIVVEVDADFNGPIELDAVEQKCREARDFIESGVRRYIDRASAP